MTFDPWLLDQIDPLAQNATYLTARSPELNRTSNTGNKITYVKKYEKGIGHQIINLILIGDMLTVEEWPRYLMSVVMRTVRHAIFGMTLYLFHNSAIWRMTLTIVKYTYLTNITITKPHHYYLANE